MGKKNPSTTPVAHPPMALGSEGRKVARDVLCQISRLQPRGVSGEGQYWAPQAPYAPPGGGQHPRRAPALVFPPLGACMARASLQGQRHQPDFTAIFSKPCPWSPQGESPDTPPTSTNYQGVPGISATPRYCLESPGEKRRSLPGQQDPKSPGAKFNIRCTGQRSETKVTISYR